MIQRRNWGYQVPRGISVAFAILVFLTLGPVAAETWQFGHQRLIRNNELPVNHLRVAPGGRAALSAYSFVGRVGGVSLEAVAVFPQGVDLRSTSLQYQADAEDGRRATLVRGSSNYRITLYDWQLRPIALFADSEYSAVVSLFGEGPDPDRNFYIEYHPAFRDTLMGLRLLHADILLVDLKNLTDLPRNEAGVQIVGPGERRRNTQAAKQARARVTELMGKHKPQSWVLTDVDRTARVNLRNGDVQVDLDPYYYFWRAELATLADEQRLARLTQRLEAARKSRSPTALIEAELVALIKDVRAREPKVIPMTELTQALDTQRELLQGINPAVYDAVVATARYAALFRAYKKGNSAGWRAFVTSLPAAIGPRVETPNQWPR
jgi:hypothetical protein